MSTLERLRRWLRLDTDGEADDLGRYDDSERRMEARVRVVEAKVEALRLSVRDRALRDLERLEEGD